MTLIVVSTILFLAIHLQTAAAYPKRPAWLPKIWWAIGMCETQLNWRHHTSDYQGAFGFYKGSWDQFRLSYMPSEAYDATPRDQYRVALRIYNRYRWTGWGCWTHGGYLYWIGKA